MVLIGSDSQAIRTTSLSSGRNVGVTIPKFTIIGQGAMIRNYMANATEDIPNALLLILRI